MGNNGQEEQKGKEQEIKSIPLDLIYPNPDQPRKSSWGNIEGLKETMVSRGLIQYPVIIPRKKAKKAT